MKRLLAPLIGILLLLAPSVSAQTYAGTPAVAAVLDRADAGIEYAWEGNMLLNFFLNQIGEWSRDVLSAIMAPSDNTQTALARSQSLLDQTACLRMDTALIEAKMEEVRSELNRALDERNVTAVVRLADLYSFLRDRIDALDRGSTDPTYDDPGWDEPRLFEPEGTEELQDEEEADEFASSSAAPDDTEPVCYFDTNYLPPSPEGYGCDIEAMEDILQNFPGGVNDALRRSTEIERDALEEVQEAVSLYMAGIQTLSQIGDILDGTVTDTPVAAEPRVHKRVLGCMEEIPQEAIVHSLRGWFNVVPDDTGLTSRFIELRQNQEADRPDPGSTQDQDDEAMMNMLRGVNRDSTRDFSTEQAGYEARAFIMSGDAHAQVLASLKPLQKSVEKLSQLAQNMDGGLRGFLRDFAYFLLRSCLDRPCTERLNRVLRIVFSDECFPYANGAYRGDSEDNQRWEQCRDAAASQ